MGSSSSGGDGGDGSHRGNGRQVAVEVETAAEGLSAADVFHIVKEIIGFVLYNNNQIPAILQHLENEFSNLKDEYKQLEVPIVMPSELKASFQRKHNMRKREVKQGIKRLEKLMNSISSVLSALQQVLHVNCQIQDFVLVLGASPTRPSHVYEISIPHGADYGTSLDCSTSKPAEAISRKAIRALLSSTSGSFSSAGPSSCFF